jgi:ectoine hydroxylase-related dioxygenase (phytanoyl-CoA dioxygenase family)
LIKKCRGFAAKHAANNKALVMAPPRFLFEQVEEMKQFFEENGFAIVSDGIPLQGIEDFRRELRNLINAFLLKAGLPEREGDAVFSEGFMALEHKNHDFIASLYDTVFQTPAFFRLIGSKHIEDAVKRLMGVPPHHPLYGYTNRCLFAPPEDERRTYGWHQEVFYTVPRGKYLQSWAPLVFDSTAQDGTIEICPGSHKEGIAKQTWNDVPGRATQVLIDDDVIAKYKPVTVDMKLGEMLIFSGYLAHRSGRNSSEHVRYSLVGMYHDVRHVPFKTPKVAFTYRGQTPREFYETVNPA